MRLSIIIPIALALLVGCKAASEVAPQNANLTEAEKKAADVESKIVKAKPGDEEAMRAMAVAQPPEAAEAFTSGLRDAEAQVRKLASWIGAVHSAHHTLRERST